MTCVGDACGAEVRTRLCRIRGSIVSNISRKTLGELRIAQAYVKLLCIPEGSSQVSVTLAQIGNCEIRIFEEPREHPDCFPLFWLELFDHRAKWSVDSCSCHKIEDAVIVFEDFISQARHLSEALGSDHTEARN